MPLDRGYSKQTLHKNMGRLLSEGKPIDQAVAIAYDEARANFHAKHPGKPLPRHLRPRKSGRRRRGTAPKSGQSWREFVAERMGPYMKRYGSHGAAIRKIGEEWRARHG